MYDSKADGSKPDVIFVASGSEVSLAIDSAKALTTHNVRVVSMPCDGLFDKQPADYRRSVIPPGVPSISLECLAIQGWERYAHAHIGMTTFGASAPLEQVMDKFGVHEGEGGGAEHAVVEGDGGDAEVVWVGCGGCCRRIISLARQRYNSSTCTKPKQPPCVYE